MQNPDDLQEGVEFAPSPVTSGDFKGSLKNLDLPSQHQRPLPSWQNPFHRAGESPSQSSGVFSFFQQPQGTAQDKAIALQNRLMEKVRTQAQRLEQLEEYKNLIEARLSELNPNHPIPVLPIHLGQPAMGSQSSGSKLVQLNQENQFLKKRNEKLQLQIEQSRSGILRSSSPLDISGKMPDDPLHLRQYCCELQTKIHHLTRELTTQQETLRGQILSNEEQRNYIEILKNALQAKIQDLGIRGPIRPQSRGPSGHSPLPDATVDLFVQLAKAKQDADQWRKQNTKLQQDLDQSQSLLDESNQIQIQLSQENQSLREQLEYISKDTVEKNSKLEKEKEALLEFVEQAVQKQQTLQSEKETVEKRLLELNEEKRSAEFEARELQTHLEQKEKEVEDVIKESMSQREVEAKSLEIEITKIKKNLSLNEEYAQKQKKQMEELKLQHHSENQMWKKNFQNEIKQRDARVREQKEKIEKATSQLMSLRSESASYKRENESLKGELTQQERLLQASQRQRETIEIKLNKMIEEHITERRTLQEDQRVLKDRESEAIGQLQQLKRIINTTDKRSRELLQEKDGLERELTRFKSQSRLAENKLEDKEYEIKKHSKQLEELKIEKEGETQRVKKANQYIEDLQDEIKRYSEIVKERDSLCAKLELDLRKQQNQIDTLEKENVDINEMRRRVGYLENQLEAASFLEGQHQEKESKLMARNQDLMRDLKQAEGEVRSLKNELHSLSIESQSNRMHRNQLEIRLEQINQPYFSMQNAINAMLASVQSFISSFHISGLCELVSQTFTEAVSMKFEQALKPTGQGHCLVRCTERLVEWIDLLQQEIQEVSKHNDSNKIDLKLRTQKVGVLESKLKRLNQEERESLSKEREMQVRLTHISDELKQKRAESESSHRREQRLQRENHELKSKLATLERENKEKEEKRRSAEATQSKMEEDLTALMTAEKKISKTTRSLQERLSGTQNELKALQKVVNIMQDFLDVPSEISDLRGGNKPKMLAAQLVQNIQEVAAIERGQCRAERKVEELEDQIRKTSEFNFKDEQKGDNQEFKSRVKLREQIRQYSEQLKQGRAEIERLLRRREELTVSLQAEKTMYLKRSNHRDNSRNRTYELERELELTKEELRRLQTQKSDMALTCAELEQRSIMKDHEMRKLKDDLLYGGSSVANSEFDIPVPSHYSTSRYAKMHRRNASHQESRDSTGTPLRERIILGQTANLPPKYFGGSGARSTARKPSGLKESSQDITPKTRAGRNQLQPKDNEHVTFRPPSAGLFDRPALVGSFKLRRSSQEREGSMSSTRLRDRLEEAKNTFKSIKRQYLEEELTGRSVGSHLSSSRQLSFRFKKHIR